MQEENYRKARAVVQRLGADQTSTLSYEAGDDLLMQAQIDAILQECQKYKQPIQGAIRQTEKQSKSRPQFVL